MNTIQFYLTQLLTTTTIFNDVPEPLQIGFQDGASPGYTGIIALHDSGFFYLVLIGVGLLMFIYLIFIKINNIDMVIPNKNITRFKLFMTPKIILLFKIVAYLLIFIHFLYLFSNIYIYVYNTEILSVIPSGSPSNQPVDPVSIWPSGVPQSMATIGSGLAVYSVLTKLGNCSPRLRVLGALGAAGASATTITYHAAIEHPVGFNRFMYGVNQQINNGQWPSLESIASEAEKERQISTFIQRALEAQNKEVTSSVLSEVKKILENNGSNSSSLLPTNSDFSTNLTDSLFNIVVYFVKPLDVEGHLDDLIGQQIIIYMSLFLMVISLILLFIFYIMNNIFLYNKDYFQKYLNNRIIILYIKYQAFVAKLTLIYLPLIILFVLFVLAHGMLYLIQHQIPYWEISNIDLHQYISTKK